MFTGRIPARADAAFGSDPAFCRCSLRPAPALANPAAIARSPADPPGDAATGPGSPAGAGMASDGPAADPVASVPVDPG